MAEASVGPYRILERLGAGAHGEVFLAEDTRLHRRVALKKLFDRASGDPSDGRRKLLREARAAARLNHPNIAAVHDVIESDDGIHIVMEYVPGTTLAARVRQGPLPPMQVLDYALQLSSALAHAHALGVIHRDLKPGNVIVSDTGRCKILDFGLARLHQVDVGRLTLSSAESWGGGDGRQIAGTPPYMPPELLRGHGTDERSDLYSLGVSLYELLTGRRPFEARDSTALMAAILTAPTPRPRSLIPDVPAGLDEVVWRAMAREPHERYLSAAELESDLKGLSAGITDAPTVSRRWSLILAPEQRRLGWTALACGAVAVAVYGAVRAPGRLTHPAAVSSPTASGPHVVAVLPLAGAAGDPQTESLAAGIADGLITTLSKVPGLTVVSRAATLKYHDRKEDADSIARELGATLLLDGGLQRSGERLRVTLTVLEPGAKTVAWQGAYDGTFAEVFTLQREVAEAVASALRLRRRTTGVDPPPTASVEAFADYAQARTFLERPDVKDNLDRSIQLFQGAIARDRRFARAHAGLGEAYWRKYQTTRDDQWSVATRDALNEALRLDPDDVSVRLSLASVYRGMGRKEQAAEELRRVVVLQPQSDEAHRQLGLLLVEAGSLEQGAAHIREAIRLRPDYWGHHYTLGTVLYDTGQYPLAVPSFRRATELQPDNAWGYNGLGGAYHAMNAPEEAIPHYQRAIALGHASAYANLGSIYSSIGRLEDAERSYREALKREPDSPVMHHNLGDVQARMGRGSEARKHFRTGIGLAREQLRVTPRDARTMSLRAVLEAKLGLHAEADRHVGQAVFLAPDDSDVRYDEAIVRTLAGHLDDAATALAAAVKHGHSAARAAADPNLAALRRYSPSR